MAESCRGQGDEQLQQADWPRVVRVAQARCVGHRLTLTLAPELALGAGEAVAVDPVVVQLPWLVPGCRGHAGSG